MDQNCKWYKIAPSLYKCTSTDILKGHLYVIVILLSSAYLLSFGIINVLSVDDPNDEKEITTLSIVSIIIGAVGILFIFSDISCIIGCYC